MKCDKDDEKMTLEEVGESPDPDEMPNMEEEEFRETKSRKVTPRHKEHR